MTWASDRELWAIAHETLSESQEEELRGLVEAQELRALSSPELERLQQLRRAYGGLTLSKARAFALLSLRGGSPLLGSSDSY